MPIDGSGLFRRKLTVQIFPQSFGDLCTLHWRLPSPRAAAVSAVGTPS
jgi:hypothetical protein